MVPVKIYLALKSISKQTTPKLITSCSNLRYVGHLVIGFCATKPSAHPVDRDGIRSRNVEKLQILTRLSAQENFIEFCRSENLPH